MHYFSSHFRHQYIVFFTLFSYLIIKCEHPPPDTHDNICLPIKNILFGTLDNYIIFLRREIPTAIKVDAIPQQQHSMHVHCLLLLAALEEKKWHCFPQQLSSLRLIYCSTEARQWKMRLPRRQKLIANVWCTEHSVTTQFLK